MPKTPEFKPGLAMLKENGELDSQNYVIPLEQYPGRAERILGMRDFLRSQRETGLEVDTPAPYFVITSQAFREWQKNQQQLTPAIRQAILAGFTQIKAENPDRGAFLGWRTTTAEGMIPSGPRTSAIDDFQACLNHVENAWRYALDNGYDQEGDEIVLVLHPFIHANRPPMLEKPRLQWPGGDVTLLSGGVILIRAANGPDEIVHSDVWGRDQYFVLMKSNRGPSQLIVDFVAQFQVGYKENTLVPVEDGYQVIKVPREFQRAQVLDEAQIAALARIATAVFSRLGPRRLEFIFQPDQEGKPVPVIRECTPFNANPQEFVFLKESIKGLVQVVRTDEDLDQITPPQAIVYLPPELFAQRKAGQIALKLAARAREMGVTLVVLAGCDLATQHVVRIFADMKHTQFFVGGEILRQNEEVSVFLNAGQEWEWQRTDQEQIIDMHNFRAMEDAAPKARNLAVLADKGISVPPGTYLPCSVFNQCLAELDLFSGLAELDKIRLLEQRESLTEKEVRDIRTRLCQQLQERILGYSFPVQLTAQINKFLTRFPDQPFCVRSAAKQEDKTVAQAGVYESRIGIAAEQLITAIKAVWASAFAAKAIEYCQAAGIKVTDTEMGVIIQPLIDQQTGGVIHGLADRIVIAAGRDASRITSGTEQEYHTVEVARSLAHEIIQEKQPNGPKLTPEQINQLVALTLEIEAIFSRPQDIEWAITPAGEIVVLQTRPLS